MIDFALAPEQEALQQSAREFLAKECPPLLVRDCMPVADGVPRGLYRELAALGWMGVLVPEAQGGLGLGAIELAALCEELGRVAAPGPFLSTQLAIAALLRGGTAAQKRTWLPRLMAGEAFGALAYHEEGAGHDAASVQLRATRARDGFVLTGHKPLVLDAPAADLLLVAARTRPGRADDGVTLFAVDRGHAGVHVTPHAVLDITRRVGTVELRRAHLGRDTVVGGEGKGGALLARLLDLASLGIAADSLGGAARTLEMALEYAKVREQFGRKIGSFQAIKHLLAEMVADVEPARSLVWHAAYAADRSTRERARAAAIAKAALSDVYSRTARRSVEIHGGIGFTWEFDLNIWFKRAHLSEGLFGDPVWHRERLATLDGY
jgi:alkylation response protein AidB-like acyl-CoA dehydrogenase